MAHIEGAFLLVVAATVEFVITFGVIVALLTEAGVSSAPELGQIATVITLELDMPQTMLLAHELLSNTVLMQTTRLADKLAISEHRLLSSLIVNLLLHSAINEATEIRSITPSTLVVFADRKCVLIWSLVEPAIWIGDLLLDVHRI